MRNGKASTDDGPRSLEKKNGNASTDDGPRSLEKKALSIASTEPKLASHPGFQCRSGFEIAGAPSFGEQGEQ